MRFTKRVINCLSLPAATLALSFGASAMDQSQAQQMMSQQAQKPCKMVPVSRIEDQGGTRTIDVRHINKKVSVIRTETHYKKNTTWAEGSEDTKQPKCSKTPLPAKQEQCWQSIDSSQAQSQCGQKTMRTKDIVREEPGLVVTRTIYDHDNTECYTVVEETTQTQYDEWDDETRVEKIVPQCGKAAKTEKHSRHK